MRSVQRKNIHRSKARLTPAAKRFSLPTIRTFLGHAAWVGAFFAGFAFSFYFATAFVRSVLYGPSSAATFLQNPNVTIGEGEVMWGLTLGAIGAGCAAIYSQKLLVRFRVLSQDQVDATWKR